MLIWILIFILGFIIIDRVRKIYRIHQCPNEKTLVQYFEGKLKKEDSSLYDQTVAHLGVCEKCQNRLVDISSPERSEGGPDLEDHLI